MAEQTDTLHPLPGANVVGRGIFLMPRETYVLKGLLFDPGSQVPFYSQDVKQSFLLPKHYAANASPPVPASRTITQTVIEETWERFEKHLGFDTSLAAGLQGISIGAQTNQSKQLDSEDQAYYALRSSCITLWSVYLPDATHLSKDIFEDFKDFLKPNMVFRHRDRFKYQRFFARYGTHYVRRVWVGGKANLVFTIAKSANLSKEQILSGIKASIGIGGIGASASSNSTLQEEKQRLQRHSECQVFGRGGDETKLALLNSLDEELYSQWIATIQENPQVVELDVVGIWTLFDDPDIFRALRRAYEAETTFNQISAIFEWENKIYIIRGDHFFYHDLKEGTITLPKFLSDLEEEWPGLKECGFTWISAACVGEGLRSETGQDLSRKLFIFQEAKCACIDLDTKTLEPGYPKSIAESWPGVKFEHVDAAINCNGTFYLFSGHDYIRYNMADKRVDSDYPALVNSRWSGVTFDRLDAAFYWRDGKVYFFREDQYIRYDMTLYRADPGYPKFIVGEYVEDWDFFVRSDAALVPNR